MSALASAPGKGAVTVTATFIRKLDQQPSTHWSPLCRKALRWFPPSHALIPRP